MEEPLLPTFEYFDVSLFDMAGIGLSGEARVVYSQSMNRLIAPWTWCLGYERNEMAANVKRSNVD